VSEFFDKFLSNDGFTPHGFCLTWRPDVFWTEVVADAAIALSYFSIPAALIYFSIYRRDLSFRWVLVLFGAFIVACGTTHVLSIWTLWVPDYGIEALVKSVTGVVSVATAAVLWPLMPRALAIPSRLELERAISALTRETRERHATQEALERLNAELELRISERTRDLEVVNQRLRQEVTERKKAEEALREQFLFTERLLETIPAPVFYRDDNGGTTGCNPAFQRFFGISPGHLVNNAVYDFLPKEFGEIHVNVSDAVCPVRSPQMCEATVLSADGTAHDVVLHRALLCRSDGRVSGLVGVIWDITERKRNEIELERARRAAENANRAKSCFLATMSHELRTPLNAILGFSEMLKLETKCTDRVASCDEYLNYIYFSGVHLLDIINDILDISKMDAGAVEIFPGPIDIKLFFEKTLFLIREEVRRLGIVLESSISTGRLWADEKAIKRILLNLLSNSMKFTSAGGKVMVRALPVAGGVELQVADNGIGIPADQVERLVKPFEQMENQYTRTYGGAGLGLPIALGLVQLHGGRLTIHSEVGIGTTVTVFLPDAPGAGVAGGSVGELRPS
jgi:PAS domain S-box-containing protein